MATADSPVAVALRDHLDDVPGAPSTHRCQGMLTACASAPSLPEPSTWLDALLGHAEFSDESRARAAVDAVVAQYHHIADALHNAGLPAIPSHDRQAVREWSLGYIEGTRLDPAWREDAAAQAMLLPLAVLSDTVPESKLAALGPERIAAQKQVWSQKLAEFAQHFHAHFNSARLDRVSDIASEVAGDQPS